MKKYIKEIIILVIQLFMLYIFPRFAGPTDIMGMIIIIIFATFLLSMFMGMISKLFIKYFYPAVVAILFIPSVFIYYNETALVHSIWYLSVSCVGIIVGSVIQRIIQKS